jgi:hypothetical protein
MAFDANFPVTNSTPWSTLYAGLRANFAAIDALFLSDGSWTVPTLGSYWLTYGQVAYKKNSCNRVFLRGQFYSGLIGTPSVNIFQLLSGYRPVATIYFPYYYDASLYRYGNFYIDNNGYVGYSAPGAEDSGFFDGVSFYVGA